MTFNHPYRRLHLIDPENLTGTPLPNFDSVAHCHKRYQELTHYGDADLSVIACSHLAAKQVAFAWPSGLKLLRSGPDGADLALLEALEREFVAGRFDELVLASGDGIFTTEVSRLGSLGIPVTVVSRRNSLSLRLRLAARHVLYFDETDAVTSVLSMAV